MAAWLGNPYYSYMSKFEVSSTGKEAILEEIVMPMLLKVLFHPIKNYIPATTPI